MAAIITWAETGKPPIQFTINDEAFSSLDQYRLTQTRPSDTMANATEVPLYPDVLSMILTVFSNVLIVPALKRFPTSNIRDAAEAAASAIAALEQAEQQFIAGAITPA